MQTKIESVIETITNLFVGFFLSLLAGHIIFPLYGMDVTTSQNMQIVLIFTIVSFIRSYLVRRFFNWQKHVAIMK